MTLRSRSAWNTVRHVWRCPGDSQHEPEPIRPRQGNGAALLTCEHRVRPRIAGRVHSWRIDSLGELRSAWIEARGLFGRRRVPRVRIIVSEGSNLERAAHVVAPALFGLVRRG